MKSFKLIFKEIMLLAEDKYPINSEKDIYDVDKKIFGALKEITPLICTKIKLDVRTIPQIKFSNRIDNITAGSFLPDLLEIVIFPMNFITFKSNRNIHMLILNMAGTLAHELTHYKQYLNNNLDLDKYITINQNLRKYKKQTCEKEAVKNQDEFLNENYNQILNIVDKYFKEVR